VIKIEIKNITTTLDTITERETQFQKTNDTPCIKWQFPTTKTVTINNTAYNNIKEALLYNADDSTVLDIGKTIINTSNINTLTIQ